MDIFSDEFDQAVKAAAAKARQESFDLGLPVLSHDYESGIDILEQADGRKFQIRFLPCDKGCKYEIVRELGLNAA
jgi:hypothetical protein